MVWSNGLDINAAARRIASLVNYLISKIKVVLTLLLIDE